MPRHKNRERGVLSSARRLICMIIRLYELSRTYIRSYNVNESKIIRKLPFYLRTTVRTRRGKSCDAFVFLYNKQTTFLNDSA